MQAKEKQRFPFSCLLDMAKSRALRRLDSLTHATPGSLCPEGRRATTSLRVTRRSEIGPTPLLVRLEKDNRDRSASNEVQIRLTP